VEEKGADETIALPAIDESFCGSQQNLVGDVVKVFLLIIRQARDPSPGPRDAGPPLGKGGVFRFLALSLGGEDDDPAVAGEPGEGLSVAEGHGSV